MAAATLDDLLAENVRAADALDKLVALMSGAGGGSSSGGGGPSNPAGGLLASLGKVAAVASLAVGAITGAVFAVTSFVKALNPGLIAQFMFELNSLYATIGGALQPVIANAIPIIRQLSAIFLNLSNELKPIIDELSAAIGAVLIAVVRSLAVGLKVLLTVLGPLVHALGWLTNLYAQFIEVQTALIQAIVDMVVEFINTFVTMGDVNDAMKAFEGWVNRLARSFAYLAGKLLVLLGTTDLLAKFRENIKKAIDAKVRPDGGLVAAPQGATTGGIEGIAQKFSEKAFAASAGAAAKKPEVGLLEEILKGLTESTLDERTLKDVVSDALSEYFPKLGDVGDRVRGGMGTVADRSATTGDRATAGASLLGGAAAVIANPGLAVGLGAAGVWPF